MNDIRIVDRAALDRLTAEAAASPRLRKNLNFHASDEDACHRLLNAVEPRTYIQPHRHLGVGKEETVAVLRGKLGVVVFDEAGAVTRKFVMTPGGENVAVHVPRALWHTWVVLEPGSVFLESKAGPYRPFAPEEKAPWAPPEGDPKAAGYLASLEALFDPSGAAPGQDTRSP